MSAKRNEIKPPYAWIPFVGIKAIAERFKKGEHYGKDNWKKGDAAFREDAFNHALEHLYKYNEKDESEDTQIENLAAVAWFCVTEIYHLTKKQ